MADLTGTAWDRFPIEAMPQDQVSMHFKFYELTRSEIADRQGIDNAFENADQLMSAVYLCRNILQRVRDEFGSFTPNSVYRGQALERALKSKPSSWRSGSQHTKGQACDIEVPGMPTLELAKWVSANLEYDQLICECYNVAKGPNSGWVHISLVPPGMGANRRKELSYIMDPGAGKYIYVNGLRESPA